FSGRSGDALEFFAAELKLAAVFYILDVAAEGRERTGQRERVTLRFAGVDTAEKAGRIVDDDCVRVTVVRDPKRRTPALPVARKVGQRRALMRHERPFDRHRGRREKNDGRDRALHAVRLSALPAAADCAE